MVPMPDWFVLVVIAALMGGLGSFIVNVGGGIFWLSRRLHRLVLRLIRTTRAHSPLGVKGQRDGSSWVAPRDDRRAAL